MEIKQGRYRCRAFVGERAKVNLIRNDQQGNILVWDDVANHFTTCHSLSIRSQKRLCRILQETGHDVKT